MAPAFLISLGIQVLLIVHCIRTGRNGLWILAIALIPLAGSLAYILIELLPSLFSSRGTRRAMRGMRKALDPEQNLRRYEDEARAVGDVASRQRYADELLRQGRAQEAVGTYQQALTGLYEHDPDLMLGLARAQFAAGAFGDARSTLDALIAHNPEYRSPDGHLLYARALEGEGNRDKALDEYAAVSKYYAGAEAPLRYARLLRASGQGEQARRVLNELLDHARLAPRHYRKMQQEWLADAARELAAL
ncbi:MAG: tetratricopeptide repeat protein [Steroidobacteraceae bacterium]